MARGEEHPVDVGVYRAVGAGGVREGRFHSVVGAGFPAVVNDLSHRERLFKGPALYAAALVRALPRFRAVPVTLRWEGGGFEGRTTTAVIANTPRTGGMFLLAPRARLDDGRLDVVVLASARLLPTLLLLPGSLRGRHLGSSRVVHDQAPRIDMEAPEGIPVYVDGEFLDAEVTRLTCRRGEVPLRVL